MDLTVRLVSDVSSCDVEPVDGSIKLEARYSLAGDHLV
jgi:hypothetical protein